MAFANTHHENTLVEIQNKMGASSFNFWLTGSRYFGCQSNQSDWDYFAEDNQEVKEFLYNLGLRENTKSAYIRELGLGDSRQELASVFEINFPGVGGCIQVQLIKDPFAKHLAQEAIKSNLILLRQVWLRNKQTNKFIWEAVMTGIKASPYNPANRYIISEEKEVS